MEQKGHDNAMPDGPAGSQREIHSVECQVRDKSKESKEKELTAGWPGCSDKQSKSRQSTSKVNLGPSEKERSKSFKKSNKIVKARTLVTDCRDKSIDNL